MNTSGNNLDNNGGGAQAPNKREEKMNIKQMEKEIIKAIKIEAEIPLQSAEGYKDLIKFVKKLFKETERGNHD